MFLFWYIPLPDAISFHKSFCSFRIKLCQFFQVECNPLENAVTGGCGIRLYRSQLMLLYKTKLFFAEIVVDIGFIDTAQRSKPLKFFTVPSDRLREFCSEGRKRGLLYVIIRDKKNPEMSEVMVFADDAAKVNRVMDKMNLDFVRSEVGEAVHEVTEGMEAPETEAVQETVQMPEGEVQFEISDLDEAFQVGDMDISEEEKNQNHPEKEFSEPENFIPVQEEGEENLSGSSLHSRNTSTGQEKGTDAGQREQERPSVRRELENIKREKAEESQKRSREKNRGPRKTQKKARNKRKVKAR